MHWVAIGMVDTDISKYLVGRVLYCNVTKRTHTSDFFPRGDGSFARKLCKGPEVS